MGWQSAIAIITQNLQAGNTFINALGYFEYNSSGPGPGNLIATNAVVSGTDAYGNAYIGGGWVSYHLTGSNNSAALLASGVLQFYHSSALGGPWVAGPQMSFDGVNTVTYNGLTFDFGTYIGLTHPQSIPATPSAGFAFYANGNSIPSAVVNSGMAGSMPLAQMDTSVWSVGNTVTPGPLGRAWTINANDGVNGTRYELETFAEITMGQTAAETLTIGLILNGTYSAYSTLGASFNSSTLSATYDLPIKFTLAVNANSSNTPQISLVAPLSDTGANRLATNSANMGGHNDGLAWNPGNNNSLQPYAMWGGTGGSNQIIQTRWSALTRIGL